ncbi:MAG: ComEC/Rec2 family competence protein [Oscillospiraceae bacterium]
MAVIGITFLLTLVFIGVLGGKSVLIFFAIGAVSFVVTISIKSLRQEAVFPSAFLAVMSACLLFLAQTQFEYIPQKQLAGQTISIVGTVVENQGKSSTGAYRYLIKTTNVNGNDAKMKIRLSSKSLSDAEYNDTVKIKNASVYELGNDNDTKQYYKSMGVYIGAYTYEEIELLKPDKKAFYSIFVDMQDYIKDTILQLLPKDEGAVLIAMQTGSTKLMSDEAYKDFKQTGVTHLFAVSGLNTSIWSMLAYQLLRSAGVRRKKSALVSSGFVFAIMALAAFTPSVMRAGLMMLIFFAGKLIGREPDSINSLGTAALLITAVNPFSAMNIGLLLSFSATLGILLTSQPISNYIKSKTQKIKSDLLKKVVSAGADIIAITLCATIFTMPILIINFKAFSLISPIANILTVDIASFAMILAGVGVMISAIPIISIIKMPIFFVCGLIAKFMLWVTHLLAKLPYAYVSLHNDYIIPWIIATLILVAVAILIKGDTKKNIRITALLSLNILLCVILSDTISNKGITKIEVADVGNGSSIIINRENNSAVIGCSGGFSAPYEIEDALFRNNTKKVDLLVVTDSEEASSGCAEQIKASYSVATIVKKKEDNNLNTKITLWDDVKIYCNSQKLSSFATLKVGELKVLITFMPSTDITIIPKEFLSADVLICQAKVPLGLEYGNFGIIIVSDEKEMAQKTIEKINVNGGNAVATGGGSIEIKTRGGKEFSARRNES